MCGKPVSGSSQNRSSILSSFPLYFPDNLTFWGPFFQPRAVVLPGRRSRTTFRGCHFMDPATTHAGRVIMHSSKAAIMHSSKAAKMGKRKIGLPVVTIRPTVFLEGFFLRLVGPTVRDRGRIELPFGRGKTSP